MKGQKAIVYVYGCVALFFLCVNFIRTSAAWVLGSGIIFFLTVLLSSMGKKETIEEILAEDRTLSESVSWFCFRLGYLGCIAPIWYFVIYSWIQENVIYNFGDASGEWKTVAIILLPIWAGCLIFLLAAGKKRRCSWKHTLLKFGMTCATTIVLVLSLNVLLDQSVTIHAYPIIDVRGGAKDLWGTTITYEDGNGKQQELHKRISGSAEKTLAYVGKQVYVKEGKGWFGIPYRGPIEAIRRGTK